VQPPSVAQGTPLGRIRAIDVRFYFYFHDESGARAAASRLGQEGLAVEVRLGGNGDSWLALGRTKLAAEDELDQYEERLADLARELGADYDGYERD
jgi:hypothetical protein